MKLRIVVLTIIAFIRLRCCSTANTINDKFICFVFIYCTYSYQLCFFYVYFHPILLLKSNCSSTLYFSTVISYML